MRGIMINKDIERWTFGVNLDYLVSLVLKGKETATTWIYEDGDFPLVGEQSILTDSKGNDVCLLKTVKFCIREFKNITWDLAKLEGEDESLDSWRNNHMNFFSLINSSFNDATLVVFEVFEVIKVIN